jgi:uncharacterized membrane protein (UPF0127 family)
MVSVMTAGRGEPSGSRNSRQGELPWEFSRPVDRRREFPLTVIPGRTCSEGSRNQLYSKAPEVTSPMISRRALLPMLVPVLMGLARFSVGADLQKFPTSELTIISATGPHRFKVELAETPAQMTQGLMFRTSLAPDAGMLFEYHEPTAATMWMRNTLIPLDMLFVDAQGRIVNIHERAVPQSLDVIAAAAPVRAVIELNGGTASRLGIAPGDQVVHPIFGNAS